MLVLIIWQTYQTGSVCLSTFMPWKSWPGWAVRVRLANSPRVWLKSRQYIMLCFRGAHPETQTFCSGQMSEGCCQRHPLLWQLCISLLRMINLATFSASNSEESNGASVLVLESGSEQSYQLHPLLNFDLQQLHKLVMLMIWFLFVWNQTGICAHRTMWLHMNNQYLRSGKA